MKQYLEYIYIFMYCNPVDGQLCLLHLFVTMRDASGSHIEHVHTQPYATGAPIIYCELLQESSDAMHAHEQEWRQAFVCWPNAVGQEALNDDAN